MKEIIPEFLPLTHLAAYASVSKKTLQKWLRLGMPHYQVGRCKRVKLSEFNNWMIQFRIGASKDLDDIWSQVMKEV